MEKRLFSILAMMLLAVSTALAQSKITGIVVHEQDQEPIIGASVVASGTKTATVTDIDGKFTINVSAGTQLTISYIGMQTQKVKAKNGMRVFLREDDTNLEEVVVTGMQVMDKRLFTGAATRIDAEKAKIDGVADISRSLEGRVAGVSVQNVSGTFGTAPKIRVRGATSIYGSSSPLWVVDGVIMDNVTEVDADALSSGDAETLIASAIAGLNSDDIESFDILKDGSATSIYGARAMAGVIVITTKKGRPGTAKLSYTGEFSMKLKPSYNNFNIMNSQDQMAVYKEMYDSGLLQFTNVYRNSTSGVYGKMFQLINQYDATSGQFGLANTEEAMNEYLRAAEYRNTDWFDELFHNSIQQNHSLSISGGNDKAQYYGSFSLMDDPGWSIQSRVRRYTANLNTTYNISKKVNVNLIGSYSYRNQRAPGTNSSSTNNVTGAVSRNFDINPYSYALNTSRTLDPDEYYTRNYSPFNIKNELRNNYMDIDAADLKFQAQINYKPIRSVELSALGAYRYSSAITSHHMTENSNLAQAYRAMDDATMRDANTWLYTDPDVSNTLPVSVLPNGGMMRETKNSMNSTTFRATVKYNDVYGNDEQHIVNFLGGTEINDNSRGYTRFDAIGVQYDMGLLADYDYRWFKQSKEQGNEYYYLSNSYGRDVRFFAQANYSWKRRYNLNGTVNYDGSNRLGKARKSRWLPTWNVSGSWNAHEETWFEQLFGSVFTNATARLSYSLTGDKPNATNAQVIIRSFTPYRPFTKDQETGLYISSLANESLTYEKKHEFNFGLDLGFFNNRINLSADFWWRNNYDLLGAMQTTGIGGSVTKYANIASMKSSGQEFSLSTRNIIKKDFRWTTDFVFSHYKTEVTELDTRTYNSRLINGNGFTLEGYPYRSLFSIQFDGLNEEGLPTFINEEGLKTVDSHNFQSYEHSYLKYEGPTEPTITGSLGNIFKYKNLSLNVFMTYSFGNVVRLDRAFGSYYSDLSAMPKEFADRWVTAGDESKTTIPVIADLRLHQNYSHLNYAYNAYNLSTERIAKGDFIRMKEISVSYDLPKKFIAPLHVSNMSAKLQATNLFLIYSDSKLNGQDPEFYNSGGVAMPMPKQFTFTLRIGM